MSRPLESPSDSIAILEPYHAKESARSDWSRADCRWRRTYSGNPLLGVPRASRASGQVEEDDHGTELAIPCDIGHRGPLRHQGLSTVLRRRNIRVLCDIG
jgi:hypothetical protein